jgi:hypothetical protein
VGWGHGSVALSTMSLALPAHFSPWPLLYECEGHGGFMGFVGSQASKQGVVCLLAHVCWVHVEVYMHWGPSFFG